MSSDLEKLSKMLDMGTEPDGETVKMSEDIREIFDTALGFYYEDPGCDRSLENILIDDDHLLEELVDKAAVVNFLEMPDNKDISKELRESAWMSLVDSLFELSKSINPLAGFGKDRLVSGLDIIKQFEELYWPVCTRVTGENIEAFEDMLPNPFHDDILIGRCSCIGALRHVDDELCAAGVIVYSIDDSFDDEELLIRIRYIYVHESLRGQGVGNFMMAKVLEMALQNEGTGIATELIVHQAEDEADFTEHDILENFFDSWKMEFSIGIGNDFAIRIADLKGNKLLKQKVKGAVTLTELKSRGPKLLKEFFASVGEYKDPANIPFEYFDPDASCVILDGKLIRSLFLVHRYDSGNYHFEALRFKEAADVSILLRTAYRYMIDNIYEEGDEDRLFFGKIDSEEGSEILMKIVPDTEVKLMYFGSLFPPEIAISTESWDELRKEAGLSDEKIPDEELDNEELTDERFDYFVNDIMGMVR